MDKLTDKFEAIHFKHVMYQPDDNFKSVQIYAQEAKKLAIEFAKQLMEVEVTLCSKGVIGESIEKVSYLPHEYSLMKGELIQNGDQLFDKFIEECYE